MVGGRLLTGCGAYSILEEWDGESENPALAFAMLDVLEAAGLWVSFHRTHSGYFCEVFGEGSSLPHQPTRTAAVAQYLIAAYKSGLLGKDAQGERG